MYFLGKKIIGVAQEMRRLMDGNLKRKGLTPPQIHVLGYLAWKQKTQGEPCNQREIRSACGDVRASTVTSLLQTLEEAGYIRREKGKDAREKLVVLTEQGANLAEECRKYLDRVEEQCAIGFERAEIERFLKSLEQVKSNLEKMAKNEQV